jgi:hypothetical protein
MEVHYCKLFHYGVFAAAATAGEKDEEIIKER